MIDALSAVALTCLAVIAAHFWHQWKERRGRTRRIRIVRRRCPVCGFVAGTAPEYFTHRPLCQRRIT